MGKWLFVRNANGWGRHDWLIPILFVALFLIYNWAAGHLRPRDPRWSPPPGYHTGQIVLSRGGVVTAVSPGR